MGFEVVEVLYDLALLAELVHEPAAGPVVERELGRTVDVGLNGSFGALRDEPGGDGERRENPVLYL